ncbi:hypothetical protein GG804_23945 [Sphingomonas histidinilytica]|uniref:DUF4435 domain-containing protein n=1 Tax=Rhizorhabdus histidinilytica TaxID=439228 RepID=UPI001ADA2A7A|nr:DUF4435 domain-containing protein [Rhizorhabdus histidinilytica]MBO9379827.1 hypothetical protein [Rhizorhabdus histidinilytica]
MFERSKSGQQNRAIFLNATITCYVEGGGGRRDAAPDISFWNCIFSIFRPDLKIRCVPRGGKPVLERLAREVIEKDIANTLVAMDSDYDAILGHRIIDRRILYSHGYSWENDALHSGAIKGIYQALTHCAQVTRAVRQYLSSAVKKAFDELRVAIKADFYALTAGSSVLPRDAPGRIVAADATTGLPVVKRAEIIKLCKAANAATRPRPQMQRGVPDAAEHCVGKIVLHVITLVLRAAVRKFHRRANLSSEHVRDTAIHILHRTLPARGLSPAAVHHRRQCMAI